MFEPYFFLSMPPDVWRCRPLFLLTNSKILNTSLFCLAFIKKIFNYEIEESVKGLL